MQVVVNNNIHEINANDNLESVLSSQNLLQAKGIAVAVNQIVIQKKDWSSTTLKPNDKITIIRATQGG